MSSYMVTRKKLVSPAETCFTRKKLGLRKFSLSERGRGLFSPEKGCKNKKITCGPPGATLNGPGGNLFFRKLALIAVKKWLSVRSEGEIGLI